MWRKAMITPWLTLLAVLILKGISQADDSQEFQHSERLTVQATIVLPDGSPASEAIVHSYTSFHSKQTVTADSLGRVEFQDHFLSNLHLHALSADARYQAGLLMPSAAVRVYHLSEGLTIRLKPATPHQIVVMANGQPVEQAHVVATGKAFRYTATTASDGTAVVWHPEDDQLQSVVAWHSEYGVNGVEKDNQHVDSTKTELSLLTPGPHVIRILDNDGRPVSGCTITASVRLANSSSYISAREIEATRATSDENGEVRMDWFPAEGIQYVDVELLDEQWKEDETDYDRIPEGTTTVHVRRKFLVEGRVLLPETVDAHGILITGFGFGPGNNGDIPRTRTRKDGTFSLPVAASHGYVMGVSDTRWSSDLWSGTILPLEGQAQQDLVLLAYPATPVQVVVTRGSARQAVADAWVHISRRADVDWTDEMGESRRGSAGVRGWLLTDEDGVATTGVGRGDMQVRITAGDWTEEKTVEVTSHEPLRVDFHRPWIGNRVLKARPIRDGAPYTPSPEAVALAWSERSPYVDKVHKPTVGDDGLVEVEFDEVGLALLLLDRKQHFSGFAQAGADDSSIDLTMQPLASYSGTLVDGRDDRPLSDRTVRLITDSSFLDVIEPQQTDAEGRFEFRDVPVGVPLRLSIENEPGEPEYALFGGKRVFEPGEQRASDVAKASLMDGNKAVPALVVEKSVSERIASALKTTRLMGMHTVVLLEGDESKPVKIVSGRLSNIAEVEAMARYLPVVLSTQQQHQFADQLSAANSPRPDAGELVLAVWNGAQEVRATLRLNCSDVEAAFQQGVAFLEQHMPEMSDGRVKLEEARDEARLSGRTVWVITGGPRCGPCFSLARWIDEHHEVLEKDLVIVKLTSGVDEHADEIRIQIGGAEHGIPFHALISDDGQILLTSEGPLGNIGMPSSVEGIRHFQNMLEAARERITSEELGELVRSLTERR